ncbi:MAG: hypothetical protein WD876_00585, partial [Candidatus Pacearchaeota archaeon]
MSEQKGDFSHVSYTLGIISIVLAFFSPIAGLILGVVGVVQSRKSKGSLSAIGKTLSTIGIIVSVIMIIFMIIVATYTGLDTLNSLNIPTN